MLLVEKSDVETRKNEINFNIQSSRLIECMFLCFLQAAVRIPPYRNNSVMSLSTEDTVLYSIIAFIVIENVLEIYLSLRQVSVCVR